MNMIPTSALPAILASLSEGDTELAAGNAASGSNKASAFAHWQKAFIAYAAAYSNAAKPTPSAVQVSGNKVVPEWPYNPPTPPYFNWM